MKQTIVRSPKSGNTKDLEVFLLGRAKARDLLNQKISELITELQDVEKTNKETVLYELPLEETIIFLGEQQRDNLFSGIQYPAAGLFLRKLTVFLKENVGEAGGLKYYIDIRIRCTFNHEGFNNHWSEFSFDNLSFDDEGTRFLENSMGVCLDPRFSSKEKYDQIKEALLVIRKELHEALTV